MLAGFTRNSAVRLFGLATTLGLHRLPGFNRGYLAFYGIYKRYFEAGPIERLQEFVPEGSLVIDVGANVGFFSRRFAAWVGDGGKVISIEPEDRNYDNLVLALRSAGLSARVEALKAVAAAEPGIMHLETNPLHPADHKLSRDGTGLPVNSITLDQLVPDKGRLKPALVKIDVQGAEMLVLRGAADILKISRPALFIELHEEGLNRFGTSVAAVLDHLGGYGYQPCWLRRAGPCDKADPIAIDAEIARIGYVDMLFLHNDRPSRNA